MKVLIAALNWGLGHATRSAALIRRHLQDGDEVVIGGDGDSLAWLKHEFPQLLFINFAPLNLHYSKGKSQVWAMVCAIPKVLWSAYWDHKLLNQLLEDEHFDLVISDNRFGLYSRLTRCVYVTHQLHICLPKYLRWLSPLADKIHQAVCKRFDEVWIPDYEDISQSLAGELSHPIGVRCKVEGVRYIGPLSRFAMTAKDEQLTANDQRLTSNDQYDVVAVLSGLEPQRSLFEEEIVNRISGSEKSVLIVRGKPKEPFMRVSHGNITFVTWLDDSRLVTAMQKAERIIARSGYSTIMDLEALGLLKKQSIANGQSPIIELHPTPGQSEQEYLAEWNSMNFSH